MGEPVSSIFGNNIDDEMEEAERDEEDERVAQGDHTDGDGR